MNWRALIRRSASIVLWTGILLMLLMIWVEEEPGGIPLVLIAVGSIGLVLTYRRPSSG